jgi:hypothetical protein
METANLMVLIPVVSIICVFTMICLTIVRQGRIRELQIKERMAMIERGLTPPPEAVVKDDPFAAKESPDSTRRRFLAGGIIIVGIGIGVGLIIGVAGNQMNVALGVGGAIVVVGLALIVNSQVATR